MTANQTRCIWDTCWPWFRAAWPTALLLIYILDALILPRIRKHWKWMPSYSSFHKWRFPVTLDGASTLHAQHSIISWSTAIFEFSLSVLKFFFFFFFCQKCCCCKQLNHDSEWCWYQFTRYRRETNIQHAHVQDKLTYKCLRTIQIHNSPCNNYTVLYYYILYI